VTTPAPPLTEAELNELLRTHRGCSDTCTAWKRIALALESELAQLRRELERSKLSAVAEDGRCRGCGAAVNVDVPHRESDCIAQLRREHERRMAQLGRLYEPLLPLIEREHSKHPHLTLADEAVDAVTALVTEKAEREELYRRRDAYLNAPNRRISHTASSSNAWFHTVILFEGASEYRGQGSGPTYEAALAAALEKVEKG
jgi:hypothetical protein